MYYIIIIGVAIAVFLPNYLKFLTDFIFWSFGFELGIGGPLVCIMFDLVQSILGGRFLSSCVCVCQVLCLTSVCLPSIRQYSFSLFGAPHKFILLTKK
jgi:hypothetical protein